VGLGYALEDVDFCVSCPSFGTDGMVTDARYRGPFWSSLVYAIIIKRRISREFGEGGEVAL
jgi:hypothetical protein